MNLKELSAGHGVLTAVQTGQGRDIVLLHSLLADRHAFDPVLPIITEALDRAAADGVTDPHQLQQVVRRVVGRWVNEAYRRRPMIVPTVVEV